MDKSTYSPVAAGLPEDSGTAWDTDGALFDYEAPPPVSLADKFGISPMSVLDRRAGDWLDRKRRWLALGIQSELGRDAVACRVGKGTNGLGQRVQAQHSEVVADGTSVFDPVVCELAYRWHTLPGDRVLDPFAGGSVRGIVASTLARYYVGIDLRGEQIEANEAQAHLGSDIAPRWIQGDSLRLDHFVEPDDEFDLIFSCPPYGDLEKYSDHPADLSAMAAEDFDAAHRDIISHAVKRLRRDRFAVWVISDVRDRRGAYRGLVADTIGAFKAVGLTLHNDAILLDPRATAELRAERPFRATRKLTRVHQHMLIFVKGSAKGAAARLEQDGLQEPPEEVARLAPTPLPDGCEYWELDAFCGAQARPYPSGYRCHTHSPAMLNGHADAYRPI